MRPTASTPSATPTASAPPPSASTATTTRRPWPWTTSSGPSPTAPRRSWWTWASRKRWARGEAASSCAAPARAWPRSAWTAASVQHVILSHFHYDHVGNYALFPNATFYVQDSEMAFYTGRHAALGAFRHSVEVDDVCALVRLNYDRPHCSSWTARARSCPASPCTTWAATPRGCRSSRWPMRAARRWWPPTRRTTTATSRSASPSTPCTICRACTRHSTKIRELASSEDLVLPGHDPLVLERLKKVGDGIVEL